MNYTLIGHTEDSSYYDRCGDLVSQPGIFTTLFFRDADRAAFLKAWAHARFHETYENLIILVNGVPQDQLDDDEYSDEYVAFQALESEMEALLVIVKAEHEAAEKARKEAAAQAALVKSRQIAQLQRERDLLQLEELKRRLNVK